MPGRGLGRKRGQIDERDNLVFSLAASNDLVEKNEVFSNGNYDLHDTGTGNAWGKNKYEIASRE